MKQEVIVLSLGGSLIIPDRINLKYLNKFKQIILKNTKKYKFVVVCGGGQTARNYIQGLPEVKNKKLYQTLLGIAATRLNAKFMAYFFQHSTKIPKDMVDIKNLLRKNNVVFCGALRYSKDQTSDSTAAKIARYFNSDFINLTNVDGLYTKDPKKFKTAKFIQEITHDDFLKIANKIAFKPGQHFILDQKAAKIIKENKITTYIMGSNPENLDKHLNNKHFIGTVIHR